MCPWKGTDEVKGPGVKLPMGTQNVEFDCRSLNYVVINLTCLAPMCEGGGIGFHGGPVIAQVNDMFLDLVLAAVSCMSLSEDSGCFISCDATWECLVKIRLNKWLFFAKNLEASFFISLSRSDCLQYTVLKEVLIGLSPIFSWLNERDSLSTRKSWDCRQGNCNSRTSLAISGW